MVHQVREASDATLSSTANDPVDLFLVPGKCQPAHLFSLDCQTALRRNRGSNKAIPRMPGQTGAPASSPRTKGSAAPERGIGGATLGRVPRSGV